MKTPIISNSCTIPNGLDEIDFSPCPSNSIQMPFVHSCVQWHTEREPAQTERSFVCAVIRHILLNNGFITNGMSNFHNFVLAAAHSEQYLYNERSRFALNDVQMENVSFGRLFAQTKIGAVRRWRRVTGVNAVKSSTMARFKSRIVNMRRKKRKQNPVCWPACGLGEMAKLFSRSDSFGDVHSGHFARTSSLKTEFNRSTNWLAALLNHCTYTIRALNKFESGKTTRIFSCFHVSCAALVSSAVMTRIKQTAELLRFHPMWMAWLYTWIVGYVRNMIRFERRHLLCLFALAHVH